MIWFLAFESGYNQYHSLPLPNAPMIRYDHPVVNLYMEAAWWYHTLVVTSLKWLSESHPLDLWMVRFMVELSASLMPFCWNFFRKQQNILLIYELPGRLKLRFTKLYSILLDGTLDDEWPSSPEIFCPFFRMIWSPKTRRFCEAFRLWLCDYWLPAHGSRRNDGRRMGF